MFNIIYSGSLFCKKKYERNLILRNVLYGSAQSMRQYITYLNYMARSYFVGCGNDVTTVTQLPRGLPLRAVEGGGRIDL